jgi:tetratricopeptide (TPR) repeat protein
MIERAPRQNGSSGLSGNLRRSSPPRGLSSELVRSAARPQADTSRGRRRRGSLLCVGAIAFACSAAPSSAHAQAAPPAAPNDGGNLDLARSVAVTGREAFNAGDYETALTLFRKAYSLYAAPTVVLYEARTLEKMGHMIEALDAYSRTALIPVPSNAPAQFAEAIAAAHEEGEALRARIPTLEISIRGALASDPDLFVTINGRAMNAAELGRPQRLNPGTYRIVGSIGADRRATADLTLLPSQKRRVELTLSPQPQLSASAAATTPIDTAPVEHGHIPVIAYVAGGVGVAGIGAGVITGMLANHKYEQAEQLCEDHRCPAGTPGLDAVDAFRTWRMVSSISYGVGAAGIAAGVVLWLTASDDAEAGQVGSIQPWGTAKTAGIRGTF